MNATTSETGESDDPGYPASSSTPTPRDDNDETDQPPPEPTAGGVVIEWQDTSARSTDCDWIERHVRAAADHLGRPVARVGIVLVDDEVMTELHREHCDQDGTTDVLTFPFFEDGAPIDTDLVLCVDEAARQAIVRGHAVERELLLYAIHGLLHCAGFDDHDEAAYAAMHAREDEILRAIGVGTTFDVAPMDGGGEHA